MTGDEKTRHCAQCNLKVHNLSAMTGEEAEALLRSKGDGRLCIGFYRRADGTVLTQDCPVGLAKARARVRRLVGRMAAAVGLVSAAAAAGVQTSRENAAGPIRLRALNPFSMLAEWLAPSPPPMPPAVTPNMSQFVKGERCVVPPPSANNSTTTPNAAN
jgi:hypothetical protein